MNYAYAAGVIDWEWSDGASADGFNAFCRTEWRGGFETRAQRAEALRNYVASVGQDPANYSL
jgi:hypothetical protein